METQLVRLDAPYNLICNEKAEFGLHIATLMVINDKENERHLQDFPDNDNRGVYCYPVVAGKYELGGDAWMYEGLKGCRFVATMDGHPSVTLRNICDFIQYFSASKDVGTVDGILKCASALKLYGVDVVMSNASGVYDVEIEFDIEPGRSFISSAYGSDFYCFVSYIFDENNVEADIRGCMDVLMDFRSAYLAGFAQWGVKDITFSTKDDEYRHYVDELNKKAHAAE